MPFADYANFADCVRQNPQADDPDAYCGSIKARTENKAALRKAVASAVRLALDPPPPSNVPRPTKLPAPDYGRIRGPERRPEAAALFRKAHDPVKEEGDKKLKEAEGVAADGAQDDQAFAVAFGPENYDKLTKRIIAAPYREAYQAAGAVVKAIQSKAMNFPGDLEDHLKKAHAAVHGREMWDARYGNVCKLLKQARKLLHDIEKTAEVAAQGGEMPQAVGKADPLDKAPVKKIGTGTRGAYDRFQPKKPNTFLGKPVDPSVPSSRTGMRPAGWGTPADQRRANRPKNKALRKAVTAAARQAER